MGGNAFDEFESIFLPAYGLHHGLEYEQALKKLEKAVPLLKADKSEANRDRHAQFYWLKGSCLRHLGKIEKSKKFLEKAVEQDGLLVHEAFVVPYALFELGEIEADAGNYE